METPKNLFPHKHFVSAELRKKLIKQKPLLICLSGLSGSGKSTLLDALSFCLFDITSRTTRAASVLNNRKNKLDGI